MNLTQRIAHLFGRVDAQREETVSLIHESFAPDAQPQDPAPAAPDIPAEGHLETVGRHVRILLGAARTHERELSTIIAEAELLRSEVRTTIEAFELAERRLETPLEAALREAAEEVERSTSGLPGGVAVFMAEFFDYSDETILPVRIDDAQFEEDFGDRMQEFPNLTDKVSREIMDRLVESLRSGGEEKTPAEAGEDREVRPTEAEASEGGRPEQPARSQRRGSHGNQARPDRPSET